MYIAWKHAESFLGKQLQLLDEFNYHNELANSENKATCWKSLSSRVNIDVDSEPPNTNVTISRV